MNFSKKLTCCSLLLALGLVLGGAKPAPKPVQEVQLSERGQELFLQYTRELSSLQSQIKQALPRIDEGRKAAYFKTIEAEKAADAELKKAQAAYGEIAKGQSLVAHAKGKWIAGAEKDIADAQAKLKAATTDAERETAKAELASAQKNLADGQQALKDRQAQLDAALKNEPALKRDLEAAEKKLAAAQTDIAKALAQLGVEAFLASDKLDGALAKHLVMFEATPRGLAEFAQQSPEHEALIKKALSDSSLLLQIALADGVAGGQIGQAMKIYSDIQKASPEADQGTLQRLALAVSLEHAVPIRQSNPKAAVDAPSIVDPINRYKHYEKAFLDGELDPAFKDLSVWDLRMVVYGDEPDQTLTWARQMLRNYRPDQITTSDYRWRYVDAVRTEVRYGSQDNKYDRDDLQNYQNMIMNGGVCGRRAFFGRFILRAFGIPTTARPQPGHAALVHWTPDGWVINLGAGWGSGTTNTRYKRDQEFLATTQIRANDQDLLKVKRAQWIGDVMGEKRVFGLLSGEPEFWYGLSLNTQRHLIAQSKAKALEAVGQDIAEANETKEEVRIEQHKITDADRKITIHADGSITLPAVATSNPTDSTGKILFMPSVLGGMQLHYNRNGAPQNFEYTFDVPAAGKYEITARVVTNSPNQRFLVTANDAKEPVNIAVPHTIGMWDTTQPVVIELVKGRNVLRFAHTSDGYAKGVTIKDFTFKPVR